MNIFCFDLELNQLDPTKIIQIGYVIANPKTGHIVHENCIYVNPNEQLLPEIVELTGISQEQVDHARQLKDAYIYMLADISKYHPNKMAYQWGGGDLHALRTELGLSRDDFFFKESHINVKAVYQSYAMANNLTVIGGLGKAAKNLYGGFKGRQHNALDDAKNTWYVMYELMKKWKLSDRIMEAMK